MLLHAVDTAVNKQLAIILVNAVLEQALSRGAEGLVAKQKFV